MEFSLKHIIKKPKNAVDRPILLLMLHGYGSNMGDLFSFADDLPEDLLIVSAQAPLSLGFGSFAWYPIQFDADQNKFTDIPKAIEARDLIVKFIDELQDAFHFDREKSMLMGFSQGAILSYAIALSKPDKIRNVLALSGYLLPEIVDVSVQNTACDSLDFFCSHGSVDPVIPVLWARQTVDVLLHKQIKHQYKEFPVGHGVSPENFKQIKFWIEQKMGI